MRILILIPATVLVAAIAVPPSAAHAASVADFYKGKTIDLSIGYSAGGGYDVYARALARHLGNHIPGNPMIVPKNMPGAGSLVLANWLYQVAPKDGTSIAGIGRGIPFDPLLGGKKSKFDATKFTWLGSMNNEVSVCVAWHTTGIKTIEDAKKKELTVGGTGAAADTDQFPKVLDGVLGTKFKVVTGYPGGNEVNLAMERGEVGGRCGWSWSSIVSTHAGWVKDKKVNILVQLALSKHPDLPNVPLVMDLATSKTDTQMLKLVFARQPMGRPFLAPPDIPADRAAALRKAFMDTLHDKAFLADAAKSKLEINPVSGDAVEKIIKEVYQTPKAIGEKVAAMVNQ